MTGKELENILKELRLPQNRFAKIVEYTPEYLNRCIKGKYEVAPIVAKMAILLKNDQNLIKKVEEIKV